MSTYSYRYDHMEFTKFVPKLKKEIIKSLIQFGKRVAGKGEFGLQRHLQRAGGYSGNNPWWKEAKGKRRVFYDSGFWRSLPSYKLIAAAGDVLGAVEVGFVNATAHPSQRQSSRGMDAQQLASFLVKDSSWTPSPNQRRGFWKTIKDRGVKVNPKDVQPKKTYRSPPRDFVEKHLMTVKVKRLFIKYIDQAVQRTYKTTPRKKVSAS